MTLIPPLIFLGQYYLNKILINQTDFQLTIYSPLLTDLLVDFGAGDWTQGKCSAAELNLQIEVFLIFF